MVACRMSGVFQQHVPVLLDQVLDNLITSPSGTYLDATFGRGQHAQAILQRLSPRGRVIAVDKDHEAISYAQQYFVHDHRFTVIHSSFANMRCLLSNLTMLGKIDGILFDLGVSSPQFDNPERGFSFSRNGMLDMRMDTTQDLDAKGFLATVNEATLVEVLQCYGEERFARRIARAIITARAAAPITTTVQLANIIKSAVPPIKYSRLPHVRDKHPATRSFQAIRIVVNQELTELSSSLAQTLDALTIGGRLAVISFHSLEDRLVKQFIRQHEKGREYPRGLPIKQSAFQARLKSIGKAIKPNMQEIHFNTRARSAILRIAEKVS